MTIVVPIHAAFRFLARIFLPFRHSEAVSGWLALIPYGSATVTAIGAYLLGRSLAEILIWALFLFVGLAVLAGTRMELELRAHNLNKPIPKNRDAVIKAARAMEVAALHYVDALEDSLKVTTALSALAHDPAPKRLRFEQAREDYWTEWQIAGEKFRALIWYSHNVDGHVRSAQRLASDKATDSELYQWIRERIIDAGFRLWRSIDNGTSLEPWGEETATGVLSNE